jgi:hypothetical protein
MKTIFSQGLVRGLLGTVGLCLSSIVMVPNAQASSFPTLQLDANLLQTFNQLYVNDETAFLNNANLNRVDLNSLFFANGTDPLEVYFINEGAGYRNRLDFSLNGGSTQTIFGDISSVNSVLPESNGPLTLGEGRNLGAQAAGTNVSFSLLSNGDSQYAYNTTESLNVDGLQHVVGYEYGDYLILGFEDLYGGLRQQGEDPNNPGYYFGNSDRDFNDVVIAVKGLKGKKVAETPEPGVLLGGLMAIALGTGGLRRSRLNAAEE